MADQHQSFINILDNIDALIFAVDPGDKRIIYANKTCRRTFGSDCVGKPYGDYMPVVLGFEHADGDIDNTDTVSVSADQEAYVSATRQWLAVTIDYVPWPGGGNAFFVTGFDITEKKLYEENIRNLAFLDYLTGLPNRYRCELDLKESLERLRTEGGAGHVLFVDLDDFKVVNDCYGHDYGDGVLVSFAAFLLDLFRADENRVYRLGGDEFVIILGNADNGVAQNLMNAMLERAKLPWRSKDREFHCSLSIGAVEFGAADDSASLLKKADIAMYRAKKAGKNNYAFYRPDFDIENRVRREVEVLLREAVRDDFQGVRVRYQPYCDTRTGRLIGAEALMRLREPGGDLLLPEDFLDLAEYLGLILQLGEKVIQRAAALSREINGGTPNDFGMTINLSAKQFRQRDIVPRLYRILSGAGADPRNFIVSVREETVIADTNRANQMFDEFHRLGVRVALDYFGAGEVVFMDMRALRVDIVKLAPWFIQSFGDEYAGHFLRSATELFHLAGKTVCANGVETAEQYAHCRRLGIGMAQGFYIGLPADSSTLAGMLDNRCTITPQ